MTSPDPETPENPYLVQPSRPAETGRPPGTAPGTAPGAVPGAGPGAPYGAYPPSGPYGAPAPYAAPVQHHAHGIAPYGSGVPWGPPPDHPNATTAMALGIVGIVAFPPLAPVAWIMGGRARREIDASGGRLGGRSQATTGYVTGIIGSVMLGLFVAWFGFVIALLAGLVTA